MGCAGAGMGWWQARVGHVRTPACPPSPLRRCPLSHMFAGAHATGPRGRLGDSLRPQSAGFSLVPQSEGSQVVRAGPMVRLGRHVSHECGLEHASVRWGFRRACNLDGFTQPYCLLVTGPHVYTETETLSESQRVSTRATHTTHSTYYRCVALTRGRVYQVACQPDNYACVSPSKTLARRAGE